MDVKTVGAPVDRGVVSLLAQLNKGVHRLMTDELLGLRLKPYMVLGYIRDHPGATQAELESSLFLDANSVVLILNELEAAHFSIRRRDPNDRRRHIVELTPEGRRMLDRADKARESLEGEVLKDLTAEERTTLRRLLGQVLDSLLAVPPRA